MQVKFHNILSTCVLLALASCASTPSQRAQGRHQRLAARREQAAQPQPTPDYVPSAPTARANDGSWDPTLSDAENVQRQIDYFYPNGIQAAFPNGIPTAPTIDVRIVK